MNEDSLTTAIESLIDEAVLKYGNSPLYGAFVPYATQQMILNYLEEKERTRRREECADVNYRLTQPYKIKDGRVLWGDSEVDVTEL